MIKKKKLISEYEKTIIVANNLLGEWGSMQMTVMSELIIWRLTIYGSAMVWNVGAVCHVKPSR